MISFGVRHFSKFIGCTAVRQYNTVVDKTLKMSRQINALNRPESSFSFRESHKITPYIREQLVQLTNQTKLPEEEFVFGLQKSPLIYYSKFYNNQFDSKYNKEIILKIIADINSRLSSDILNTKKFENCKQSLQKIRDDGVDLLCQSASFLKFNLINPSDVCSFVLNYVEVMHELLKTQDSGTYYTDFAKDFIKNLCAPGDNTQLFFTFKNLNEQYFIDVRPLCLYPVHLMSLPDFSSEEPLAPTKGYVESKLLDFREVTFHDIGHAHVMSRQDKWLFETCNRNPLELVKEWLRNKDWYLDECKKLFETNCSLHEAVKLLLFDITHDRGYQFYLPILKQQFKAIKNLENLKTRIMRGEFDNTCDRGIIEHLDEARKWLLDVTDKFMVRDNVEKIEKYKKDGYIIKKYPDVESHRGVPTNVTICKNGKILVNFDLNGTIKTTSLYEIELIGIPVGDTLLNDEKIHNINKWMNIIRNSNDEFIQLDSDANILNVTDGTLYKEGAVANDCVAKPKI